MEKTEIKAMIDDLTKQASDLEALEKKLLAASVSEVRWKGVRLTPAGSMIGNASRNLFMAKTLLEQLILDIEKNEADLTAKGNSNTTTGV